MGLIDADAKRLPHLNVPTLHGDLFVLRHSVICVWISSSNLNSSYIICSNTESIRHGDFVVLKYLDIHSHYN